MVVMVLWILWIPPVKVRKSAGFGLRLAACAELRAVDGVCGWSAQVAACPQGEVMR